MTDKQKNSISFLISELQRVRGMDFADAPSQSHVAVNGKFKGQTVVEIGLSAVNPSFPNVIVSERGGFDIESVSSYPESKSGHARYDDGLPATALSACIYGDLHLAKAGYGRKPKAIAAPAEQTAAVTA